MQIEDPFMGLGRVQEKGRHPKFFGLQQPTHKMHPLPRTAHTASAATASARRLGATRHHLP
jgi:hypothetical protein